jgi:hypothetical protein
MEPSSGAFSTREPSSLIADCCVYSRTRTGEMALDEEDGCFKYFVGVGNPMASSPW